MAHCSLCNRARSSHQLHTVQYERPAIPSAKLRKCFVRFVACEVLERRPPKVFDPSDPLALAALARRKSNFESIVYWCARALAQHETETSAEWTERFRYWEGMLLNYR